MFGTLAFVCAPQLIYKSAVNAHRQHRPTRPVPVAGRDRQGRGGGVGGRDRPRANGTSSTSGGGGGGDGSRGSTKLDEVLSQARAIRGIQPRAPPLHEGRGSVGASEGGGPPAAQTVQRPAVVLYKRASEIKASLQKWRRIGCVVRTHA